MRTLFLILIITLFTSCATTYNAFTGRSFQDLVEITSTPDSAYVYIDGKYIDMTPCIIYMPHTIKDVDVRVNSKHVNIRKQLNPWTLMNIIFPPLFLVDILSGEIIYYETATYHVKL